MNNQTDFPPLHQVIPGLPPPAARPSGSTRLQQLILLADSMNSGDAAVVLNTEVATMRIILATLGYNSATDGWRSEPALMDPRHILLFKLPK